MKSINFQIVLCSFSSNPNQTWEKNRNIPYYPTLGKFNKSPRTLWTPCCHLSYFWFTSCASFPSLLRRVVSSDVTSSWQIITLSLALPGGMELRVCLCAACEDVGRDGRPSVHCTHPCGGTEQKRDWVWRPNKRATTAPRGCWKKINPATATSGPESIPHNVNPKSGNNLFKIISRCP